MKHIKRILTLCMAAALLLCSIPAAYAAEVPDAIIDPDAKGSISLYKYDWTNAVKDGVWDINSFTTTGVKESYVENILGTANGHTLGNGETSNGYAIKGVEFSCLKVADMVTFSESANDEHPDYAQTMVLYGFNKVAAADLLAAIGLENGKGRYENADNTDKLSKDNYYYTANALNTALASALASNATTVKNALEAYMAESGGVKMPLTDANGYSSVSDLPLGLYLLVETKVPEMVTSTTNPFFISLPMTTVNGNEHASSQDGGQRWNYDVTIYPKNETGIPTLEKTVRESKLDTGKNTGSTSISDGYAHNATASTGDILEYQIISTLPTITSKATSLSTYSFYDTLDKGLTYQDGVKIDIYSDKSCTTRVASWSADSGKFDVSYSGDGRHMTVTVTDAGLAEINGDASNVNGTLYAGYSNYTIRVTYTALVNSDASFVYGENGNENEVVLTWKRTNSSHYDTLNDDAHVYSFGIDLTKVFTNDEGAMEDASTSEKNGLFSKVKFKIYNQNDGYWVQAKLDKDTGIYYVTGHTDAEKDATIFTPVTSDKEHGRIILMGCEDDTYIITETETADGYTLLKDDIELTITAKEDSGRSCDVYSEDLLGVLQNDPYYSYNKGGEDLTLANIPQKQLAHTYMTATANIDGNAISMTSDNNSANAKAPATIVNARGFDLPQTGDTGTWVYTVVGIVAMAAAAAVIIYMIRRRETV